MNIEEMNENIVTEVQEEQVTPVEEVTETVETSTEKTPKTYTEEEFEAAVNARLNEKLDEVMPKKIARKEAKIRKEYERKYGDLETVLRVGTGKQNESVEEITDGLREFYVKKGAKFPEKPSYSDKDIAVLANAEAEDIIQSGFDEVVEEVERLAKIGAANMTPREKATFKALAEYRQKAERGIELSKIGVNEDIYNSKEFTDFAGMFNPSVPIAEVYKMYAKTVKPVVEPIGSMKNGSHDEVKTFYTPEEVDRLTSKDYDNPVVFENVRKSMKLWK